MLKSHKIHRLSEAEVKLAIGDWLTGLGLQVFDEKQNKDRPQWGVFKVRNINRGKRPDLVLCGNLSAAHTLKQSAYVAVEIKCGYKHHDILDGFDAILDYFSDYLWGAEYRIDNKAIQIAAFVFATFFSQQGFLFEEEGKFDPRGIVRGPWDAYLRTDSGSWGTFVTELPSPDCSLSCIGYRQRIVDSRIPMFARSAHENRQTWTMHCRF